ncbi:MAG: ATP-binding cassette domain-containing protein, partial [Gemmatimonadaceae bacterium]
MTSTLLGRVELRHFSARFGPVTALHDVNLAFAPRAVTALVGPSGCGKTTLLRATNRLNDLMPNFTHTGEILLDEEDVYASNVDTSLLRQRVGMVFQRSNPFPKSIFDNVAYGA